MILLYSKDFTVSVLLAIARLPQEVKAVLTTSASAEITLPRVVRDLFIFAPSCESRIQHYIVIEIVQHEPLQHESNVTSTIREKKNLSSVLQLFFPYLQ